MAHHAEPMDVDDEGGFDNKENTYQHSNVLPKTPSTEKGYEELDVSELNMKLRYSITPAASPMSKSMSHCLDHRQNNLTDESLNNTVINEFENNLTRSLNSTLKQSEVKSSKVLPLQALPTDVEGNRSSVLRSLDSATCNDITITVSNENEVDNISFPSSSSSMAETPEATTPTKEIPKHDGGSPIMRGLKSVLSMFRSSQSPIPPEGDDVKTSLPVLSPADVPLPESKPRAIASTPKSENNKEKSLSRRNSPHKESIVFNEDLETELQWNDDSTIVFSTDKIPIHKLFFQDKPSKLAVVNDIGKQEDANSTVEYMDVSYNDLSVKDRTLNGTVNRSRANELAESDGEFVDCETTFTQNETLSKAEVDAAKTDNIQILNVPEQELKETTTTVEEPFTLDTTTDIIKLIGNSHIAVEGDLGKPLDCSTTDIVNQLSDLINESDTSATNIISVDNKETVVLDKYEAISVNDVQTISEDQPKLPENEVASPDNIVINPSPESSGPVSNEYNNLDHTAGFVCHTIVPHVVSVEPKISSAPVDTDAKITHGVALQMLNSNEVATTIKPEGAHDIVALYPNPVDIPLPSDEDINENIGVNTCLQDKDSLNASTSQNALMSALDKSAIEATPNVQHTPIEPQNEVIPCQPSLLSSDVPLPNRKKDLVNTYISHEAITAPSDPVDTPEIDKPQNAIEEIPSKVNVINETVDKDIKVTNEIPNAEAGAGSIGSDVPCSPIISPSDIPLPGVDDDNTNELEDFQQEAESFVDVAVQNIEKPVNHTLEEAPTNTIIQSVDVKSQDVDQMVNNKTDVAIVDSTPAQLFDPVQEHMEISFIESNNDKLSETISMDVSMVDANIKVEDINSQKDIQSLNVMPQLTEIVNGSIDIVNIENVQLIKDHNQITSSKKVEPQLPEIFEDNIKPVVIETSNDENKNNVEPEKKTDEVPPETTANIDLTVTESIKCESPRLHTLSEIAILKIESNIVNRNNAAKFDINVNKVENTPIEEEIILSESNSPFVSISAEEEFDSESKKENFEKIDNTLLTKSKVTQSPPTSPKIVSKGYNFNFDDMDTINPFATKAKIRMSPPPGASPNNSPMTDKLNKTEIVKSSKSEKDVNRRKSMPERKKPLRAKRHLNSSVDSTENNAQKTTPSQPGDVQIAAKIQPEQEQPHLSLQDLIQDTVIVAPLEGANDVNQDFNNPLDIITHDKVHQDPASALCANHTKDEIERKGKLTQNDEAILNKAASSESPIKPDSSSSEQSTYFSAGASSTELTDSKNVFNLPELDAFNPFATKSKIRQSPSRDFDTDNPFATISKIKSSPETSLVVTGKDCNSTVLIANGEELKVANCSGSSQTSDEQKDATVHEVHTEDEDTIEGPFLDADDDNDGAAIPELPDDKVYAADIENIKQQDNNDAAEMFIDAKAFEFLMNQNKSDEVAYSGKESLFLKFDPLFARRVTSEGVAAALIDIKRKQNTPKKPSKPAPPKEVELLSFEKLVAVPSDLNGTYEAQKVFEEKSDDMNITASKPTMAVTPVVTPRTSLTPNKSHRLSMTFTSPAMAMIDRLLSLSSNSPAAGLDTTVTHCDRSHNETDQALTQLREMLAEKEIHVYNLRCETKELKDRLSTLETQMKTLEVESAERLKKVNDLNENLAEKTKVNRNMAAVVEEYERTIASLISETEQDKKRFAEERNQLIRDRDEQTAHLASMEVSFNDLHSKYEKSKQVIMGYKTNEEAYKKSIQDFEESLAKMHTNYELLKQHATSKLNHANQELEKINKAHEGEILKFNAMLKRKEVHITSLEETLAQKTKANEELTAICDELINKVG